MKLPTLQIQQEPNILIIEFNFVHIIVDTVRSVNNGFIVVLFIVDFSSRFTLKSVIMSQFFRPGFRLFSICADKLTHLTE